MSSNIYFEICEELKNINDRANSIYITKRIEDNTINFNTQLQRNKGEVNNIKILDNDEDLNDLIDVEVNIENERKKAFTLEKLKKEFYNSNYLEFFKKENLNKILNEYIIKNLKDQNINFEDLKINQFDFNGLNSLSESTSIEEIEQIQKKIDEKLNSLDLPNIEDYFKLEDNDTKKYEEECRNKLKEAEDLFDESSKRVNSLINIINEENNSVKNRIYLEIEEKINKILIDHFAVLNLKSDGAKEIGNFYSNWMKKNKKHIDNETNLVDLVDESTLELRNSLLNDEQKYMNLALSKTFFDELKKKLNKDVIDELEKKKKTLSSELNEIEKGRQNSENLIQTNIVLLTTSCKLIKSSIEMYVINKSNILTYKYIITIVEGIKKSISNIKESIRKLDPKKIEESIKNHNDLLTFKPYSIELNFTPDFLKEFGNERKYEGNTNRILDHDKVKERIDLELELKELSIILAVNSLNPLYQEPGYIFKMKANLEK